MKQHLTALALGALIGVSGIANAAPRFAQADEQKDASPRGADTAGLVRENNITSTGATVPHPGASQGPGTTPLDLGIERQNDRIQSSICKGC